MKIGFIGAGAQATSFLMPAFRRHGAVLQEVSSTSGVSGLHAAKKFGFKQNRTDTYEVLHSCETDVLVITTRHDSHAELLVEGFQTGKAIFIEKPLCLNRSELDMIIRAYQKASREAGHEPRFMLGYNRRYAPLVKKIKSLLGRMTQPAAFVYTINAGKVPLDHWVHDPNVGGGRMIGEICHFIDLIIYLSGGTVQSKHIVKSKGPDESVQILLGFDNGSTATINYLTNGSKKVPKEKLEVFCGGAVLVLDNYRKLKGYGWPSFQSDRLIRQDKGFFACVGAFLTAIKTRSDMPIALADMIAVSEITFDLSDG
jgi:predicted dehydrogenase